MQNPAKSHIFDGKSSISIEQPVRNPNLDEPKLVQTCPDMTRYHSWLKKWSKTMNLLPKLCKILQKVIFSMVKVQFPLNNMPLPENQIHLTHFSKFECKQTIFVIKDKKYLHQINNGRIIEK